MVSESRDRRIAPPPVHREKREAEQTHSMDIVIVLHDFQQTHIPFTVLGVSRTLVWRSRETRCQTLRARAALHATRAEGNIPRCKVYTTAASATIAGDSRSSRHVCPSSHRALRRIGLRDNEAAHLPQTIRVDGLGGLWTRLELLGVVRLSTGCFSRSLFVRSRFNVQHLNPTSIATPPTYLSSSVFFKALRKVPPLWVLDLGSLEHHSCQNKGRIKSGSSGSVVTADFLGCSATAKLTDVARESHFPTGNTFGATGMCCRLAFTLFGSFWLSLWDPRVLPHRARALGFFFTAWFGASLLVMLAALHKPTIFIALFAFLSGAFFLLGLGEFTALHGVTQAGGALGIITALIAYSIAVTVLRAPALP
ncbi:hypothetical protein B0H13DRAFT_1875364 [Mycena leptocephala]|nr:hypothetical protein B0H13DRAFT_1875364 [Mycena leptocephala]